MNISSIHSGTIREGKPVAISAKGGPILIVPYMWIGDFVRCHSVVKLLRVRWPDRPVDMLTTTLCAPLLDYMPDLRRGIAWNLPRGRLPMGEYRALAARLRAERYGTALIMPRTWKSALAPFLAGIPERVGFVGEARFFLLNDLRWGERKLPRMIDRCAALALPKGTPLPAEWPLPDLAVPDAEVTAWRSRQALPTDASPIVALAPGAVGPGKRWPTERYAEVAKALAQDGAAIWILGGPQEKPLAAEIVRHAGERAHDLTGSDLRNAILALKAADIAVSNDSGLMHIAAASGTPTIGIFGPTDPRLWAPLNPLAAVVEPPAAAPCPVCGKMKCGNVRHRRTSDIPASRVIDIIRRQIDVLPR
ncbi:MAG: lipopolysaccharide heptosyltransferase II [Xanthobacteraceae bacterium]